MDILVLGNIHPRGISALRADPRMNVLVLDPHDQAAVDRHAVKAAAILVRTTAISGDLIDRAKNLRVISRHGVGFDNIDVAALTRRRIPLAVIGAENAPSPSTPSI